MQSTVLRPMVFFGGSRLIWGSWEVRLVRASMEMRRPGIIMPPMKFLSLSTTEMVVAVPMSMMIRGQG